MRDFPIVWTGTQEKTRSTYKDNKKHIFQTRKILLTWLLFSQWWWVHENNLLLGAKLWPEDIHFTLLFLSQAVLHIKNRRTWSVKLKHKKSQQAWKSSFQTKLTQSSKVPDTVNTKASWKKLAEKSHNEDEYIVLTDWVQYPEVK